MAITITITTITSTIAITVSDVSTVTVIDTFAALVFVLESKGSSLPALKGIHPNV